MPPDRLRRRLVASRQRSAGLFVSDGSVFTTGAAANPTLTIVALATRRAEYIATELNKTLA